MKKFLGYTILSFLFSSILIGLYLVAGQLWILLLALGVTAAIVGLLYLGITLVTD